MIFYGGPGERKWSDVVDVEQSETTERDGCCCRKEMCITLLIMSMFVLMLML